MAGRFIPFAQYNQDLARSMSGLEQVYPSRQVTVTMDEDTLKNIDSKLSDIDNTTIELTDKNNPDYYGAVRNEIYAKLYDLVSVKSTSGDDAPSMGDINFLSHEVQGGWVYNDIYVHVTPEQGKKTFVFPESGRAENPKVTGFNTSEKNPDPVLLDTDRESMTFNAIILYYNLYKIDPESKTAATSPIVIDMPLGIYIPESPVTIDVETEELYGQGTSWSTRICSRFATSDIKMEVSADRNNEYATLTKVLSQFGEISEQVRNILTKRDSINPEANALTPTDIKSYLEEFRRLQAVNVPYIKDGQWFVNGRNLGTTNIEDLEARIKRIEEKLGL